MADHIKRKITVCSGTACIDPGGKKLEPELRRLIADRGIGDLVEIEEAVCYGQCKNCPMIVVEPETSFYGSLDPLKLERIIDEHIIGGRPVEELVYQEPGRHIRHPHAGRCGFLRKAGPDHSAQLRRDRPGIVR